MKHCRSFISSKSFHKGIDEVHKAIDEVVREGQQYPHSGSEYRNTFPAWDSADVLTKNAQCRMLTLYH